MLQGDTDYIKYGDLIASSLDTYQYSDIETGLARLKNPKTIVHSSDATLRGFHQQSPAKFPSIKTFGQTSTFYFYLIFTKNSPLAPMFLQESRLTWERGEHQRLEQFWKGRDISKLQKSELDTTVLSAGQMFLAFCTLLSTFLLCLTCLGFEKMLHKCKQQNPVTQFKMAWMKETP